MSWWIGQSLVIAMLLACVVCALCQAIRPGPAARHALWLVVLIKLLTPPLVVWPWSVPNVFVQPGSLTSVDDDTITSTASRDLYATHAPQSVAALPIEHQDHFPQSHVVPPEPMVIDNAPVGIGPAPLASEAPVAQLVQTWPVWSVRTGGAVWLAGAVCFAVVQALRIMRMSLRLRGSSLPSEEIAEQFAQMAGQFRTRPIEVRIVNGLSSPCIWAVVRPRLLWPAELRLSRTATQGLIIHELAHVKRRDHWVGWLELVASCVWWWNPLFWYVRHQLRENAELACDAWVVETLPAGRRAYAEALLAVCEFVSKLSAPLPAIGLTTSGRHAFERRLKMIARGQTPFRLSRGGLLAALVLAAMALPAWSQLSSADRYDSSGAGLVDSYRRSTEPELPDAAQKLYRQYQQSEAEARRNAEAQTAKRRRALLRELKTLQDRYAREGLLDEAVAVRDHIRKLQPPMNASAGPLGTPTDLTQFRGQHGTRIVLTVVGDTSGTVWGNNPYTDDSSVAAAAVHAGVLQPGERGVVQVVILAGAAGYEGSIRNGVSTSSYGEWAGSFRVEVPPKAASANRVQSSDPGSLKKFRDRVGQTLTFKVTGKTSGSVWGSDVYTDDSSLATAAVHAGILQPGQTGIVRVRIMPGRADYEGSTTRGVTTHSYGPWEGSFQFVISGAGIPPTDASLSGGWAVLSSNADRDIQSQLRANRGKVGESFQAIVTGTTNGPVWGTEVYTDDSSLAVAAVHAGALQDGERGVVRVTILEGRPEYEASIRNGVTSGRWDKWGGSFRVEPVEKLLEPPPKSIESLQSPF
ncbi:MAG: LCCL domain-containing protein [Pirellulales bacterium]